MQIPIRDLESFWPQIRDPGWEIFGSGINIPDPQHWIISFQIWFPSAKKDRRDNQLSNNNDNRERVPRVYLMSLEFSDVSLEFIWCEFRL